MKLPTWALYKGRTYRIIGEERIGQAEYWVIKSGNDLIRFEKSEVETY